MIRNELEHKEMLKRIEEDRTFIAQQRASLEAMGLPTEDVEYGLGPMLSFHAQLREEVDWYERVKRGEIGPVSRMTQVGQLLIAARIALSLSQKELAGRLGVSEAQVSKDERNEYHGISVEKADRVIQALGAKTCTSIELHPNQARDLVSA